MGTIVLDLLADAAPNHVAHFITRAREGAYDGTTFHRVIAMGIIQGGDPLSKDPAQAAKYGTGGLGVLRFEANAEKHTRGAVSAVLVPGPPRQRRLAVLHQRHRSAGARRAVHRVRARGRGHRRWRRRSRRSPADDDGADRAHRDQEGDDSRQAGAGARAVRRPRRWRSWRSIARCIETSLGNITVEVLPDRAPNHVRQFLRLAAAGVYDGTAFHRVVEGFVIQGGHMPTPARAARRAPAGYVRTLQPEFNADAARAGHRLDGARRRSGQRDQLVLHRAGAHAGARQPVHGVRARRRGAGRGGRDRGACR